MPKLSPISRRVLIRKLRKFGFSGPYAGGKHEYMIKGAEIIMVPNPHGQDIGVPLLRQIINQIGIDREQFELL